MKKSVLIASLALAVFSATGAAIQSVAPANAQVVATQGVKVHEIDLKGAMNVRDLGGYRTTDGKTIKSGRIIRSASLANLTKADQQKLTRTCNLKYDVDLRTPMEMKAAPDPTVAGVDFIKDPVFKNVNTSSNQTITDKTMEQGYTNFVTTKQARTAYHNLFTTLLNNKGNSAVLYHCSAGKDRAGAGTIFILSALGVKKLTIVDDYLATKGVYEKHYAQLKKSGASQKELQTVKALEDVKPAYINATYSAVKKHYGTMDNFLNKGLRVSNTDIAKLRAMYLK